VNRLAVFGILATGLVAGALAGVKLGHFDGEEPERALIGSVSGLAVAGAGLWGLSRRKKYRKPKALSAA